MPNWVLTLLVQYPTAKKLAGARAGTVAKIKSITPIKAQQMIDRAKNSSASRGTHTDDYLISSIAEDILAKQQRIDKLKKMLSNQCTGPEVKLLESIKGVATYSAARIMIQIEDIKRFPSPSHLAGYFGLYPTLKQSGDKMYVSRMSKKGRSAIRHTLYMCANTAVLHDPHMKKLYQKNRVKGMSHKQALGVVMHKMLRVIWGILNSAQPYDPEIDACNAAKTGGAQQDQKQPHEKRRLQQYDENAPISRRAFRKRKTHQSSQVSKADQVRDPADAP